MADRRNEIAQRLLETVGQFGRIKRHQDQNPVVGLKHSEIAVLYCIKNAESGAKGVKVSEISNMLRVTAPSVTQLINGLVVNGYVERQSHERDRRSVRIRLTEKGDDVIKAAMDALYAAYLDLVDYLGVEESVHLADTLEKVVTYFYEKRWQVCKRTSDEKGVEMDD